MAKKEQKDENSKESKIKALKHELQALKAQGTFKAAYVKVRKGTVEILKADLTDDQRKEKLEELFESVSEEMNA